MRPRLVALSGPLIHATFLITEKVLTVGRAADTDVILDDHFVSRHHFSIQLKDGRPYLRDRDTPNGTWVNHKARLEKFLEPGDRIKCGSTTFLYLELEGSDDDLPVLIDEERNRNSRLDTLRADYAVREDQAVRYRAILDTYGKAIRFINAISDINDVQVRLLECVFEIIPALRAAILLNGRHAGPERSDFESEVCRERDYDAATRFPLSGAVLNEVYATRAAAMTNDIVPALCAPLITSAGLRGVIYAEGSQTRSGFEPEHLHLLKDLAEFAVGAMQKARQIESIRIERNELRKEKLGAGSGIIGESEVMKKLEQKIRMAADSDLPVLILGETGTGKELVARRIHQCSRRAENRFAALNCAAINDSLVESEFFGHVKGAFTGAMEAREGKFKQAHGGTLFLDEVGELKLEIQAKLLRVLQEQEFEPVGGEKPVKVDVRVISATNVDPAKAMEERRFRPDLFFRLNGIPIEVPALRERREDIPLLARHFIEKYGNPLNMTGVAPEALQAMIAYEWPGNVRQLEQVLRCAIELARASQSSVVRLQDLPEAVTAPKPQEVSSLSDKVRTMKKEIRAAEIEQALRETDGSVPKAALLLGLTESYLYRMLRQQKNNPQ